MTDQNRSVEARFGALVREWRLKANLTQAALARLMIESGQTVWVQSTVSQLEAGDRPVRLSEVFALCDALGHEPGEAIGVLTSSMTPRERRLNELRANIRQVEASYKKARDDMELAQSRHERLMEYYRQVDEGPDDLDEWVIDA